jgi:hypothetical protein
MELPQGRAEASTRAGRYVTLPAGYRAVTGRARNRRFLYRNYIELFLDDEPEPAR